MPYLFKLSRRVARTRSAFILVTAASVAAACESERLFPSGPQQPELATVAATIGTVSDLRVTAASDTSLTLAFTAVGDGAGLPASYDVRYAVSPIGWGSATSVTRGTCAVPLAGGSIGSTKSCTILGLARSTKYDVQLVPFTGTLNVNAVFGVLSNVATASSSAAPPAAGTVLLQEAFEDASFASRGWYDNTAPATTTAQHVAGSTRALEAHFLPGATTPTWGGAARHAFPASESVYLSYWVKYSGNWVGSGRSYHPHEFLFLTNEDGAWVGPSFTHLTTYVEHNYQNGGIPTLSMQDGANIDQSRIGQDLSAVTESRGAAGCNGNTDGYATGCYQSGGQYVNEKIWRASQPTFLPNPGTGYKGDWHFVEAYFQLNTIQNGKGLTNGIVRYWFDGQLVIDRTNVLLRTGAHATMKFNQFIMAPYIGDGSPVDQTMWIDNLTLGTGRIAAPSVPTVASVTIAPASASVTTGGTSAFTATVKDASGAVLTGQTVTWKSSNTAVATVSGSGVASGLTAGSTTITATSGSVSGSATLSVTAPAPLGTVTNLSVTSVTDTSVTLSFTEVPDGAGKPASYDVRFASGSLSWGSAAEVTRGTCATPLAGTAIGATRTCTVLGLAKATAHQFQMVAFRGTLNVNAVFGGLSNVASGTTAAGSAAPVMSVSVSPASVSQTAGTTKQFAAILKDASGNTLTGRSVTWASSNPAIATVSSSGLASGLTSGTATITATSEGRSGTATVTVTVPQPPPPPPPSSGGTWPHEPTGLTVLSDYGFTAPIPVTSADVSIPGGDGWNVISNGAGNGSVVNDGTAPSSPSSVLQFRYPVGFGAGESPATLYRGLPGGSQFYMGLWWKPSNPWQGHSSNVNKIAFVFTSSSGPIYIAMYGPPGGPYELRVLPEFSGLPINWYVPNVNRVSVTLGQWHRIEWFMDKSAGILRWWLDGQLLGDYSGVPFPSSAFSEFKLSSTWGGVGGTKSETDYYSFDHIRLSSR